jgi:predicted transcriptional regulator
MADLGHVIETVGRAIAALGREDTRPATAEPAPAVPVRRSIQQDHLVCLVCGKQQKTLRRHLNVAHQLTPEAYRERFELKPDYSMIAPSYARQRSEMARRSGLGRRGQAPPRRRRRKGQE